jgi:NADH dehydrogenase [ubiquinone] 1 alpha subcomplex assembly factor 2
MQWLRHTRAEPPSLAEQHADIIRRERMKVLAAQADERWASIPSMLDSPDKQQPTPMLAPREPASSLETNTASWPRTAKNTLDTPQEAQIKPKRAASHGLNEKGEVKKSPWYMGPKGGPSEDWQPEAWSPPARKRV